jgi:hypothetical protein
MSRIVIALSLLSLYATPSIALAKFAAKGDRIIVSVDKAAIIDQESKKLHNASVGDSFTLRTDPEGPDWMPIYFTVEGKLTDAYIASQHVRIVGVSEKYMSLVLAIVIHLLVVVSIIFMTIFVFRSVFDARDSTEQLIRAGSVGTGLLTYCAARAYGFSVPDLLASAITTVGPVQFGIVGAVVPAATGAFVAGICIRMMNKNETVGRRATLLISTFMFTMFADVYATLAGDISGNAGRYGLPNAAFVLGLMLWTIFRYSRSKHQCRACLHMIDNDVKRCPNCGYAT